MEKYKFIRDLTSDVLFEAYGKDLPELYANSAEAMFTIICKVDEVKQSKVEEFEIKGEDLKSTMWNWLSGLIAIVDTEQMFFSKFEIVEADEEHVIAKLHGEEMSPEKGETVVKSLTLYKYDVKKIKEGYKATVSLDI